MHSANARLQKGRNTRAMVEKCILGFDGLDIEVVVVMELSQKERDGVASYTNSSLSSMM